MLAVIAQTTAANAVLV